MRGLAGRCYSPKQVEAWASRSGSTEFVAARSNDGRIVWVAISANDVPVAFIDLLPNGYIDMLFCHTKHARRGLASQLYATLEAHAIATGIPSLSVNASACVKSGFEKWGFKMERRNDFMMDGITMHNFTMSKVLQ